MRTPQTHRVHHITLVGAGRAGWQSRGIGSSVVRSLMRDTAAAGKPLTLRVPDVNKRARRLWDDSVSRPFKETDTHIYLRWGG